MNREEIREAQKGKGENKEMFLLAHLINKHDLPEAGHPIDYIKIRMVDFGYTATDLAKHYGEIGMVSKVLNYKQPLSLTMIPIFSKMLRIPDDLFIKEYKLQL